jgi:hypothetical protein
VKTLISIIWQEKIDLKPYFKQKISKSCMNTLKKWGQTWGVKSDAINLIIFHISLFYFLFFAFFCVYSDRRTNLTYYTEGVDNERANKNYAGGQANASRDIGRAL